MELSKIIATPKFYKYIILLIFVFAGIMRILQISADTPIHHLFTDEGWKTFDARNYYLFGKWDITGHPPSYLYLHPIFTLIHLGIYSIFGIGYVQARLISVVFGIGIIIILFLMINKHFNQKWAAIAALLIGFNYYFLMLNRTAVIETPVIFFMVASLYFYDKGTDKAIFFLFSGIFIFISIITKLYAILLLPAIILPLILNKRYSYALITIAGFVLACLIYLYLWYYFTDLETLERILSLNFEISNMEMLRSNDCFYLPDSNYSFYVNILFKILNSITKRLIYLSHLFLMSPICFLLSFCFLAIYFKNLTKIKCNTIEVVSIHWIFFGIIVLFVSKYTSIHHLLILLPAMVILSISFLSSLNSMKVRGFFRVSKQYNKGFYKILKFAWILLMLVIIQQLIFVIIMVFLQSYVDNAPVVKPIINFNSVAYLSHIIKNEVYEANQLLPCVNAYAFWRTVGTIISVLIGSSLIPLILRYDNIIKRNGRIMLNLSLGLFIIINISRYIDWAVDPTFSEKEASKTLGKVIKNKEDIVIGGELLGLENDIKFAHHHKSQQCYFDKATYLVKLIYHPLKGLQVENSVLKHFPNHNYITNFNVCGHLYHVYKLK